MKKELFDEMQTQKRNRIGSHSFSLLVILLMVDVLTYHLGIRWIEYPTNVFIIVLVCCAIFAVRTALDNALVAPKQKPGRTITLVLVAAAISIAMVYWLMKVIDPTELVNNGSGIGAILLQLISWGALITVAVIFLIKRRQDKRNEE
jgi:cation transport ATPase